MKCDDVQRYLSAYIYGELNTEQVKKIHRHLSHCESCLLAEMQFRKTVRLMDQVKFDALPADFDEKLQKKLRRSRRKNFHRNQQTRRLILAIAATLILVLGLDFLVRGTFFSRSWTENLNDYRATASVFGSENQPDYPSQFSALKNIAD
ncbi:MAG: hypothetical protein GXO74_10185 [Calditrichaeota bacterium]|nr:hypothetical protein [Calditrichota bacterium]